MPLCFAISAFPAQCDSCLYVLVAAVGTCTEQTVKLLKGPEIWVSSYTTFSKVQFLDELAFQGAGPA